MILMLLLLLLLLPQLAVGAVTVQEITLSGVNTSGKPITSCWGGVGKDISNRIYIAIGIGNPSDDVAVFQYNSVTGQKRFLDTLKHVTQLEGNFDVNETIAKVHSSLLPFNNKLYFSSHDFHDVAPGYHRGGHFFSYDPSNDHFEDLSKTDPNGISAPGQGIIGMDIMPNQGKLIGFTFGPDGGGDVVAYSLASHTSLYWQGNPNPDMGVTRHIFTSNDNLAYISYGQSAGPQQIYAMDVTNGVITAPPGFTLRRAQIPASTYANDGDRVFLLNWDYIYLFHKAAKQFEALGELFPPSDRNRGLLAANIVLSQDETKLYSLAEGALDGGNWAWRLYAFDVQGHQSTLVADLTSQMNNIRGGALGDFIGSVMDGQGRIYLCAAEGLLMEISGLPSSAPSVPAIAWWKFDENTGVTASDATGNNHSITLNSGAAWGVPKVGVSSVRCNGTAVGPSTADVIFDNPLYTWMAWVKSDTDPSSTIFNAPLANGPTNAGTDAWGLWWNSQDTSSTTIQSIFHRDSVGIHLFKIPVTLVANTWYHIAVTFDGTNVQLYLNGTLQGSFAAGAPVAPTGPPQVCGRYFPTPWAGNIDEFRIDNRAWSASEIATAFGTAVSTFSRRRVVPQ